MFRVGILGAVLGCCLAAINVLCNSIDGDIVCIIVLATLIVPVSPIGGLLMVNGWIVALVFGMNQNYVLTGAALYTVLGVYIGVLFILMNKATPCIISGALYGLSRINSKVFGLWSSLAPYTLQRIVGVCIALLSEIALIPLAGCIIFLVARLKIIGDNFDSLQNDSTCTKGKPDSVIVLIHGNGFNESQWLLGRLLLHAKFPDDFFITVNYFDGIILCDHTPETQDIEGCSKIVLSQINAELKRRRICPSKVILQGHSLGGVIAANIAESSDHTLPVTDVICWSAPLEGSHLITIGKKIPFWRHLPFLHGIERGIHRDFCPLSEKLKILRNKIASTVKSGKICYFAITGWCDPLVRPSSALLPGIFDSDYTRELPHLAHNNIKLSTSAWHLVLDHLHKRRQGS